MRKKGFTLIELLVAMVVIFIIFIAVVYSYNKKIESARSREALVNVDAIRKAEEFYKMETGSYAGAENTEQIKDILGLKILPQYYEYRVVGITADNFIVIAQRIGEDLAASNLSPEMLVVAMNRSGIMTDGYGQYLGPGAGGGGVTGGGGIGVGGGGGTGGGGTGGGTVGGSTPANVPVNPTPVVYNANIQAALDSIKLTTISYEIGDTLAGYLDLIAQRNIDIVFKDYGGENIYGQWVMGDNTIYINKDLQTAPGFPAEVIGCIIVHETTHADYTYNPEKWIQRIKDRWGYTQEQLTDPHNTIGIYNPSTQQYEQKPILYYSVTEEYFTNSNEAQTWMPFQSKYSGAVGTGIDFENGKVSNYNQGEAAIRAYLTSIDYYKDLPDFFPTDGSIPRG